MTGVIIVFPEPLVTLKAQWDALDAQVAILVDYDPAQADAISRRCVEIEDRMAELVPHQPQARRRNYGCCGIGRGILNGTSL